MNHHFRCIVAGHQSRASMHRLQCEACGAPFEVGYDTRPDAIAPRSPMARSELAVSLGEGRTPSLTLPKLADELGLRELRAKLEFMSPTGSFKDRGTALLMSVAAEQGIEEFIEDSSGNAGASLAAYAAAAGLKAHIFVPASAGQGKKDQIWIFGAQLHEVPGPRQAATDTAAEFATQKGLVWLSHNISPYFAEGMKGFAYEIAGDSGALPDHILFPVGNGSLLIGAYKGFKELRDAGRIGGLPRLHCIQSTAVMPIVAILRGQEWVSSRAGSTVAGGIAVTSPPRRGQVVNAVQETGGSGIAVSDEAILSWQRRLAETAGIFAEVTSAAAFAGLEHLIHDQVIREADSVLVPVTGTGLKEPVADPQS